MKFVFAPNTVLALVPPLIMDTIPDTFVAFPFNVAVIVPAEKFPVASLETMVLLLFKSVAVVAEFATFPAEEMVAKFASVIPALPDKLAFVKPVIVFEPAAIVLFVNVSVPAKVDIVPVVGRVTFVAAVATNVVAKAPVVVRLPPKVIVLPVFAIPVPPIAPGIIPVILDWSTLKILTFVTALSAILLVVTFKS